VSGSAFLDNSATAPVGAQGGAMDLSGLKTGTITACQFIGNQAVAAGGTSPFGASATGGAIADGSGFFQISVLTIGSSVFEDNLVQGGPDGGFGLGGAIMDQGNDTTLNLSSSLFLGNQATGGAAATSGTGAFGGFGVGGALVNAFGATATVSDSSFFDNTATGGPATGSGNQGGPALGGAIQNEFATLTVTGSTLVGNTATGGAGTSGAIGGNGEGGGIQSAGTLKFSGGVISGNQAIGGAGGGNGEGGGAAITGGSASFTSALITLNAATGGSGGGPGHGGGLYIGTGALTTLKNTQVILNAASTAGNDIYGTYTTG
jgi:hypothetical protein